MAKRGYWKTVANLPAPALAAGGLVGLGLLWWLLSPAEAAPAPTPIRPGPSTALPPGAVPVQPMPTPQQYEDYFGPGGQGPLPYRPPPPAQAPEQPVPGQSAPRPAGNPIQLQTGGTYRARIELGAIEALAATRERVAQAFVDLGFRNVVAYQTAAELDPSWPPEARAGATDRTRWVRGTWTGAAQSIARPANVVAAWEG